MALCVAIAAPHLISGPSVDEQVCLSCSALDAAYTELLVDDCKTAALAQDLYRALAKHSSGPGWDLAQYGFECFCYWLITAAGTDPSALTILLVALAPEI